MATPGCPHGASCVNCAAQITHRLGVAFRDLVPAAPGGDGDDDGRQGRPEAPAAANGNEGRANDDDEEESEEEDEREAQVGHEANGGDGTPPPAYGRAEQEQEGGMPGRAAQPGYVGGGNGVNVDGRFPGGHEAAGFGGGGNGYGRNEGYQIPGFQGGRFQGYENQAAGYQGGMFQGNGNQAPRFQGPRARDAGYQGPRYGGGGGYQDGGYGAAGVYFREDDDIGEGYWNRGNQMDGNGPQRHAYYFGEGQGNEMWRRNQAAMARLQNGDYRLKVLFRQRESQGNEDWKETLKTICDLHSRRLGTLQLSARKLPARTVDGVRCDETWIVELAARTWGFGFRHEILLSGREERSPSAAWSAMEEAVHDAVRAQGPPENPFGFDPHHPF